MLTDILEIRADLDANRVVNARFAAYYASIAEASPFHAARSINALAKAYAQAIDCTQCGNCCRGITIHVSGEDRRRLARWVNLSETDFVNNYCFKTAQGWALADTVQCPFLEQRTCMAYEARPAICRQFPYLDLEILAIGGTAPVAVSEMIKFAYRCPIVYNVLEELKTATGFGPSSAPEAILAAPNSAQNT